MSRDRKDRPAPDPGFAARFERALRARGERKAAALAHRLGVAESTVSRWRSGGPITLPQAVRLCEALDLSLDWLIRGEGPFERAPTARRRLDAALAGADPGALAAAAELLRLAAEDAAADRAAAPPRVRNAHPETDLAPRARPRPGLAGGARARG